MKRINININWKFEQAERPIITVNLPHTWNGLDGQNGGNNYYRGTCTYSKLMNSEFAAGQKLFIELEGANSIATLYINGTELGVHKGGYSTFRFEITKHIESGKDFEIKIKVDNSHNEEVYPLMADFTFMGGLYRDVNLLTVSPTHFDLEDFGSCGVYLHQENVSSKKAILRIESLIKTESNTKKDYELQARLINHNGSVIAEKNGHTKDIVLEINSPRLWDGLADPYMYNLELDLFVDGVISDLRRIRVGLRSIEIDAEKGFILNGKVINLHGVSRHQDRKDIGWALGKREMEEDIAIIKEMGVNSIRLAHYQHNQYFYDLCDKEGIITWAEIPYITVSSEKDTTGTNAKSQMTELVKQNMNHPSIVMWGVQNEITIAGKEDNIENIVNELNNLTKSLDPSRLTAQAQVGHHPDNDSMNKITDIIGYNKYFGWYYDSIETMGTWLDKFHSENLLIPLGITEYGCEAILSYHNDDPQISDYSEEYQTKYHHETLQIFNDRPWMWGTYVWNMFDFASDLRDEGGSKGINNKGLVTHDRKIRKDSFYIYKSYWSNKDVLHIASKRYTKRKKGKITVSVITNKTEVELILNGKSQGKVKAIENIALFKNIKLKKGKNIVLAVYEDLVDTAFFEGVNKKEESYICSANSKNPIGEVANWFSDEDDGKVVPPLEFPEGYFSVKDKISKILKNPEGEAVLRKNMAPLFEHSMFAMIKTFSIAKLVEMKPDMFPKSYIYKLNVELNKVAKK